MFPNKFRIIFVAETMFPGLTTCFQVFQARETLFSRLGMLKDCFKTIVKTQTILLDSSELLFLKNVSSFAHGGKNDKTSTGNNISATMFPTLPRA